MLNKGNVEPRQSILIYFDMVFELIKIMMLGIRQLLLIFLLLISAISGSNIDVRSGNYEPITGEENSAIAEVAKSYESSVVTITGTKRSLPHELFFNIQGLSGYRTMGTGFIVSEDGKILTNKHVVEDTGAKYQVTINSGEKYTISEIHRDPNNDVAVVIINPDQHKTNKLVPARLGDSKDLKVGESIATIGNDPGQINKAIKTGVVSGVGHRVIADNPYQNRRERLNNVIETNLDLVPGNSGSPLIDGAGEVVGINTATAVTLDSQSFAIPIDSVKNYLDSLTSERIE